MSRAKDLLQELDPVQEGMEKKFLDMVRKIMDELGTKIAKGEKEKKDTSEFQKRFDALQNVLKVYGFK